MQQPNKRTTWVGQCTTELKDDKSFRKQEESNRAIQILSDTTDFGYKFHWSDVVIN